MTASLPEELIDSVYRVVLEPAAWDDVMALLARSFPSSAQGFYYLHREPRRVQPVVLAGIEQRWLQSFDALYFAPDNPWIRLTQRLHLPGVVRTNERLDRVLRERGALYRSAYYNDWMRPQGFRSTLGNTLVAEGDLVANITLFRPPGMKTFGDAEVRAFEALSRHMTRALQMAIRLEQPENVAAASAAFEALAQPLAVLDRRRRVRYANPAMEALLRRRGGLALRAGELVASAAASQPALAAYLDRTTLRAGDAAGADAAALAVRDGDGAVFTLHAVPLGSASAPAGMSMSACLLTVTEAAQARPISAAELRAAFGCTRTEARLAELLAAGRDLRDAAREMGVTYGTARGYLKGVFGKTGVHAQAQLVAWMLRGERSPGQRH
jgi:DNA-binding CsgD family transcriptional regulator/PAS domain-containing protein